MADEFDWESIDPDNVESREHLPRGPNTARTTEGVQRRTTRRTKRISGLESRLSSEMFQAGAILGMGLPTTGYYICQESSAFCSAVVQLAQRKREWIEALEHVADVGPGITIGRTCLGIGVAFAVDREKIEPDKKFAQFLGVTAAYMAVQQHETESSATYTPPPHGAFVPVT